MAQESKRHHSVPVFYLNGWARNGEVCEYSRPHRDVIARMKAPPATGYAMDLYTVPAFPSGSQRVLEDEFLKNLDQIASNALVVMLQEGRGPAALSSDLRIGWSRFIGSLHHRSPTRLAGLKTKLHDYIAETAPSYRAMFDVRSDPNDTRTFEKFCADLWQDADERLWARLFLDVIDGELDGGFLNQMLWNVLPVTGSDRKFLTSDHPVVMTDGLDRPDGHIVVPLGPTHLFVATTTAKTLEAIKRTNIRELQRLVNEQVVRQARCYVYGDDESQLRFVENRLIRPAGEECRPG